jgi:hypothetical protein
MRDHAIASCNAPTERRAVVGALAHELDQCLTLADGTHAVMDAGRTEPRLADREAHALLAQEVFARHAHALEHDLHRRLDGLATAELW